MKKELFDSQALKKLIIPLVFEQFLAVSIGFVDTFMVSTVGEAAVSGVALVDNINTLLIQVLSALATGGAVVCSQYIGLKTSHEQRSDLEKAREAGEQARRSAGQILLIMGSISFLLLCIALCFNGQILSFVFGSIEADVRSNARIYFYITALSYPFLGLYNAGAALFRAIGNSQISMKTSFVMNIFNVAGNAIFIFGFHMGAAGVALATLISRVFACVFILSILFSTDSVIRLQSIRDLAPEQRMIGKILGIGLPSGLENGMFQIGKLSVSSLTSTFGTAAIAANSVAGNITSCSNIPGNAIGMAMITVIGQSVGSGDSKEAKRYGQKLLRIAYVGIWATNALMWIFAGELVGIFHLSQEATTLAVNLLHMFTLVAIFLWPLSFSLPNALRAAGDAKFTMTVSILSMWSFRVGSSYFLGKVMGLGLYGVWMGMFIDWFFRSAAFLIRFLRGKWAEKRLV